MTYGNNNIYLGYSPNTLVLPISPVFKIKVRRTAKLGNELLVHIKAWGLCRVCELLKQKYMTGNSMSKSRKKGIKIWHIYRYYLGYCHVFSLSLHKLKFHFNHRVWGRLTADWGGGGC